MLRAIIERDMWAERRADYIANMLWSLTGSVFSAVGAEFTTPSWGSIVEDSEKEPEPELSGEEIRETLLKRWGGGG